VSQAIQAFNHVVKDLCIIINQYEQLSAFSAGLERLGTFYAGIQAESLCQQDTPLFSVCERRLLERSETPVSEDKIVIHRFDRARATKTRMILSTQHLDLKTPDAKRTLIRNLNLRLREGENLLIVGSSGAGKSSLLRAIAGLWTLGSGVIDRPVDEDVYFLPQRPYCALGSLKDQLLYPLLDFPGESTDCDGRPREHSLEARLQDIALLDILDKVDLTNVARSAGDGDVAKGLYATMDWSSVLSLGEQQRLAFGRLLVHRPRLVILDEASSALDMASEDRMYTLLRDMTRKGSISAATTYISVGHRASLMTYHDLRLQLNGEHGCELETIERSSSHPIPSW
jgi:vitamin B12/bleomycin/antimicrobial peptide transport system ATP-binding/permease protein